MPEVVEVEVEAISIAIAVGVPVGADAEVQGPVIRQEVLAVEAGRAAELEAETELAVGDVAFSAHPPAPARVRVTGEQSHEQEWQQRGA